MRTITLSSGSITTQAVISVTDVDARALRAPNGMSKPSASAPPRAEMLVSSDRRLIGAAEVIGSHSHAGGGVDRRPDALVGAATADIGDGGVDLRVARLRRIPEQGRHRHD